MRVLLLIFLMVLSVSFVYADSKKVQIYDCKADNVTTYTNIVPGADWNEKECDFLKSNLKMHNQCIKTARDGNNTTLQLLKDGKCKVSGFRAFGTYNNSSCTVDYNSSRFLGFHSSSTSDIFSDPCIKNLMSEIKKNNPNVK